MPKVQTLPDNQAIDIASSETLLDAMIDAEIPITYACGGHAHCSTCRVMILEGAKHCSPLTPAEEELAKSLQFPVHIRLACQTTVTGDVSIRRLVIDNEDIDLVDNQLAAGALQIEKQMVLVQAAIRGTTNFDTVNFPYDIIYTMSRYFQQMQRIISHYGGAIDSYMGSRFLATFADRPDIAQRAVWAALEMQQAVEKLNQFLEQMRYQPLQLSIGLHFSPVILLPVPKERSQDRILLGGAVGTVNRIETANASLGSSLLVSETVLRLLKEDAIVSRNTLLQASAKGKQIAVYEVTGMRGEAPEKVVQEEENPPLSQRIFSFMQKLGL